MKESEISRGLAKSTAARGFTMYARSRYTLCTVTYTYVTVIKMQILL